MIESQLYLIYVRFWIPSLELLIHFISRRRPQAQLHVDSSFLIRRMFVAHHLKTDGLIS